METISLKALARKVLQRNSVGNSMETSGFQGGNFKGVSFPARKLKYKLDAKLLGCHLLIVDNAEDIKLLRSQGITEAIYTTEEIQKLKGADRKSLKAIHVCKEVFPMSSIVEYNPWDKR
jgi:hypothetical protein